MDETQVVINRPSYTNDDLITTYRLRRKEGPSSGTRLKRYCSNKLSCSAGAWKRRLLGLFPFVGILMEYEWKKWLIFDILAGLSVGAIHIPQGMGFSLLTSLPPVYGLYTSFFPVVIYFFFATSRHISMGTMALTSLVIGSVVDRELEKRGIALAEANSTADDGLHRYSPAEYEAAKVDVAMSVSVIAGLFQLLMALLHLSRMSMFMSRSFMGGFLNGAAVQIIGSQMLGLFGVQVKNPSGVFRVPRIVYLIIVHIKETNFAAIVTGLICILVLVILKEVINNKFKDRMKMPIPAELIVLVLGTIISHYLRLHDRYHLRIIGYIPQGMPEPVIPSFTNYTTYIADAFVVSIISFAVSFTMVNMMAEKHKYRVDANQEMFAYGVCHTIGPFLNSFTGCQAPPRTLVHEAVGGKTQVGSLVSSLVVFLVFMFLGQLFESLPVPVLAAIIIVALFPLFKQFKDLKRLWRVSKADFLTWIVTFLTIVIFDITIGLVTGVLFNMLVVLLQPVLVSGSRVVSLDDSDIYISDGDIESKWKTEPTGVKVFRFEAPLFYMNISKFKAGILQHTVNCDQSAQLAADESDEPGKIKENGQVLPVTQPTPDGPAASADDKTSVDQSTHTIVIDCSRISYIDEMGLALLKTLRKEYEEAGIDMVLADVPLSMMTKLNLARLTSAHIPSNQHCPCTGDPSEEQAKGSKNSVMVCADKVKGERKTAKMASSSHAPSLFTVYPTVHDAVVANAGNTAYVYKF